MKKRMDMKSLILGALLGVATVLSIGAAKGTAKRTAWEYTNYTYAGMFPTLDKTNELGKDGWDLVCSASGARDGWGCLIFKRQK